MKKLRILLLATVILIGCQTLLQAQNGEKLFREGMMKEEGAGKLDEAIAIYYKVVNDVAAKRAKALMHVGICYEKLGKKNAQGAYEQLIAEYGDQTDIVAVVRKKLQSLKGPSASIKNRGLITEQLRKGISGWINLYHFFPDGESYLYLDQTNDADEIMTYNLLTAKKDSLTTGNTTKYSEKNSSFPWSGIISPDGKNVAYMRGVFGTKTHEVRLIKNNEKNGQVILSGPYGEIPRIESFSPDGKNILGTLIVEEDGLKNQKLVIISIADKKFHILKNMGDTHASQISYSPDGKNLLYVKSQLNSSNQDIYVMSLHDMKETQITTHYSNEYDPLWSASGNQILFVSDRLGTQDLFKIEIEKGKPTSNPTNVKRNLGDIVKIMNVNKDGSVYYASQNKKRAVYTLDLEQRFNNIITEPIQITNPAIKNGGFGARFSKDGRYISYLTDFGTQPTNGELVDKNLGKKYYINIYDTETKKNKLLNVDLYINIYPRELAWHTPSWSYNGYKLLVQGTIKDNYQGGFFIVDAITEELTPVLTVPNTKLRTEYKRFGNSMIFSRNKNKIYYSAPDWKELMQYDMATKQEESIVTINDGFWFEGFLDKEETKCIAYNRYGKFLYDVNTHQKTKFREKEDGGYLGVTNNGKYYYFSKDNTVLRVSVDGSEPDKTISFDNSIPDAHISNEDLHPDGKHIVISATTTTGKDIYKLTGVFDQ